jgi:spermidine/putrescine transport system ATP-binding protein
MKQHNQPTLADDKIIEIKEVSKSFDDQLVLDKVSMYIRHNEFVTLLGPSGCGKTTLLRILAGFESVDSGVVLFNGQNVLDIPAHKRPINTVFQQYALFPHLDVYDNIAFGLRMKKTPENVIEEEIKKALELVKLSGYESRKINQLSGGQQQRVAIARAIINKPKVLLLDEPLGALDLKLRQSMQKELKDIQQTLGISFVFVTHDQEEALTMSDTVIVMNEGEIMQIGTPEDIYNEPENAFTADFIGESNIVPGVMHKDFLVSFEGYTFTCVDKGFEKDQDVFVVLRPEDIEITPPKDDHITGSITNIVFLGVHYEITVAVGDHDYLVHSTQKQQLNETVSLSFTPSDIHVMEQ